MLHKKNSLVLNTCRQDSPIERPLAFWINIIIANHKSITHPAVPFGALTIGAAAWLPQDCWHHQQVPMTSIEQ